MSYRSRTSRRSESEASDGAGRGGSGWLELGAVLLLLIAACVVRLRGLDDEFDHEFAGYQGAFFATAAIDYERLGFEKASLYPSFVLDGPSLGDDDLVPSAHGAADVLVYLNHPPLVPLLAWCAAKLAGPDGWNEAWREGRAPVGLERAIRLPFFALHMFALAAFWWMMREGFGARTALVALALFAVTPVSILLGTHVNYENPSLPFVFLALGAYACYARDGRTSDLCAVAVSLAIGCSFTFAPLFFVPAIALHALATKGWRFALTLVPVAALGALLPMIAHFAWTAVESDGTRVLGRAAALLEPLRDGSLPLERWGELQLEHMRQSLTPTLLSVAAVGAALALLMTAWRGAATWLAPGRGEAARERVDVALPLVLGSALYLFAFYRHSALDQRIFMLYVAPGVAACAALLLDVLATQLAGRFAAPLLVVMTGALAAPCLIQADALDRAARGGSDAAQPLHAPPRASGAELAALLPAKCLAVYPAALGYNLAPAFYAWRNFAPLRSAGELRGLCERFPAACDRPVFALLPRDLSALADSGGGGDDGGFVAWTSGKPPALESAHWRAWRVQ